MIMDDDAIARVGEFQELAWQVELDLKAGVTAAEQQAFLKEFTDFMEENQLGFAGELADSVVVSLTNRQGVTLAERRLIKNWLMQRPEVDGVLYRATGADSDAWLAHTLYDAESPAFTRFFS
ncbi:MAG: DUF469 family protein [Hymenobacter sp.]|nr:MAG: DUF469 family protein [Hymenobacter sp.]